MKLCSYIIVLIWAYNVSCSSMHNLIDTDVNQQGCLESVALHHKIIIGNVEFVVPVYGKYQGGPIRRITEKFLQTNPSIDEKYQAAFLDQVFSLASEGSLISKSKIFCKFLKWLFRQSFAKSFCERLAKDYSVQTKLSQNMSGLFYLIKKMSKAKWSNLVKLLFDSANISNPRKLVKLILKALIYLPTSTRRHILSRLYEKQTFFDMFHKKHSRLFAATLCMQALEVEKLLKMQDIDNEDLNRLAGVVLLNRESEILSLFSNHPKIKDVFFLYPTAFRERFAIICKTYDLDEDYSFILRVAQLYAESGPQRYTDIILCGWKLPFLMHWVLENYQEEISDHRLHFIFKKAFLWEDLSFVKKLIMDYGHKLGQKYYYKLTLAALSKNYLHYLEILYGWEKESLDVKQLQAYNYVLEQATQKPWSDITLPNVCLPYPMRLCLLKSIGPITAGLLIVEDIPKQAAPMFLIQFALHNLVDQFETLLKLHSDDINLHPVLNTLASENCSMEIYELLLNQPTLKIDKEFGDKIARKVCFPAKAERTALLRQLIRDGRYKFSLSHVSDVISERKWLLIPLLFAVPGIFRQAKQNLPDWERGRLYKAFPSLEGYKRGAVNFLVELLKTPKFYRSTCEALGILPRPIFGKLLERSKSENDMFLLEALIRSQGIPACELETIALGYKDNEIILKAIDANYGISHFVVRLMVQFAIARCTGESTDFIRLFPHLFASGTFSQVAQVLFKHE